MIAAISIAYENMIKTKSLPQKQEKEKKFTRRGLKRSGGFVTKTSDRSDITTR